MSRFRPRSTFRTPHFPMITPDSIAPLSARNARSRFPHFIALSLLAAIPARAGFVTWSSPKTITGDSDISQLGAFVSAYNLGGVGNPAATVNGVTFNPFATNATTNTVGNVTLSSSSTIFGLNMDFGETEPPFSTLTPGYQTLLQSGSFTTSSTFPPATISMTLNGLTPGADYQFQWWAHESEASSFAPAPPLPGTSATAGNSVTLQRRGVLPGSLGQFALGVFTATSASQVIDFNGTDTKTLLSAFQLRQIAAPVPEPGSALFGFAMAGVAFRSASKRRR